MCVQALPTSHLRNSDSSGKMRAQRWRTCGLLGFLSKEPQYWCWESYVCMKATYIHMHTFLYVYIYVRLCTWICWLLLIYVLVVHIFLSSYPSIYLSIYLYLFIYIYIRCSRNDWQQQGCHAHTACRCPFSLLLRSHSEWLPVLASTLPTPLSVSSGVGSPPLAFAWMPRFREFRVKDRRP